jgi:hypothetical protein
MKIAEFRATADRACRMLGLWSPEAVQLVTMTACHESRLEFRRQFGGGPAYGLTQMEPKDHDDIWENYLRYLPELSDRLRQCLDGKPAEAETMIDDDLYAAAMCRIHYRRAKPPLPHLDDPDGMAGYWKRFYNSSLGAGTPEEFKSSYLALAIRDAWAS